jgi:periplasmic copper chaperone A
MKRFFVFLFALLMAMPVAAHEAEPGYRKGQIHAIQSWARINPVPGRPAAVFLVLHNESAIDDALLGVSTPIAGRAEIHRSRTAANGVVTMEKIARVAVKAGDIALLEPGGMHLMLFDIKSLPDLGKTFPLTLRFARGKPQTIEVMAKPLGTRPDLHKRSHHP